VRVPLTVDVKLPEQHVRAEKGNGFVHDVRIFSWVHCETRHISCEFRDKKDSLLHPRICKSSAKYRPVCSDAALMGGSAQPQARSKVVEENAEWYTCNTALQLN
jgi:hypothetical protein